MKDKDLIQMQILLENSNQELLKQMVGMMNVLLICIKKGGKVYYRTAEEDAEIRKRHTHDKTTV